jgi:hypothetical protein
MKLMHYGFGTEIKTIMVTLVMRFTLLGSQISVHESVKPEGVHKT